MSLSPPPLNAPPNSSHVVINWPLAVVIVAALVCLSALVGLGKLPVDIITHAIAVAVGIAIPLPISRKVDAP